MRFFTSVKVRKKTVFQRTLDQKKEIFRIHKQFFISHLALLFGLLQINYPPESLKLSNFLGKTKASLLEITKKVAYLFAWLSFYPSRFPAS